jgi:hypothetical protein
VGWLDRHLFEGVIDVFRRSRHVCRQGDVTCVRAEVATVRVPVKSVELGNPQRSRLPA